MSNSVVGSLLRRYRFDNAVLQRDLAKLVGVNARTLSRWEHDVCLPDPPMRLRLLASLTAATAETKAALEAALAPAPSVEEAQVTTLIATVSRNLGISDEQARTAIAGFLDGAIALEFSIAAVRKLL